MVQMCKMIISPGVFFFYFSKIFINWAVRVKRKNAPQMMTKNIVTLHISGTIHHIIVIFGTQL